MIDHVMQLRLNKHLYPVAQLYKHGKLDSKYSLYEDQYDTEFTVKIIMYRIYIKYNILNVLTLESQILKSLTVFPH